MEPVVVREHQEGVAGFGEASWKFVKIMNNWQHLNSRNICLVVIALALQIIFQLCSEFCEFMQFVTFNTENKLYSMKCMHQE